MQAELAKHGAIIQKEDDMNVRQLATPSSSKGHYHLFTIDLNQTRSW